MAADPLTRSTVDDLFSTEFSDFEDDPFAENLVTKITDSRDDKPTLSPRATLKRKNNDEASEDFGLGLDSEVKIVKKKKPIAKLDEARLLSEPGIPKLRALTRLGPLSKKLRLKGKGHEFTDAARLLNHFQLWLDNLYPRAKFADALQLAEKAGHSKRMHITRTEWINEGKPGYRKYEMPDSDSTMPQNGPELTNSQNQGQTTPSEDDDTLFVPDANQSSRLEHNDEPHDDELDALLADQEFSAGRQTAAQLNGEEYQSEGEDDLDALLAAQDMSRDHVPTTKRKPGTNHGVDGEDELEALLAEQEAQAVSVQDVSRSSVTPRAIQTGPKPDGEEEEEEDDDDELETLLATAQSRSKSAPNLSSLEPGLPTPQTTSSPVRSPPRSQLQTDKTRSPLGPNNRNFNLASVLSSSPVPNNPEDLDLDDLDALLASQEAKLRGAADQPQTDRDGSVTPRARRIRQAEDELLSSSPIPNQEESQ